MKNLVVQERISLEHASRTAALALGAAVFLAFSHAFYQGFYLPKALAFGATAVAAAIYLAVRTEIRLPAPRVSLFVGLYILTLLTAGLYSVSPLGSALVIALYAGAAVLYLAMLQLDTAEYETLLSWVGRLSVFEAALAIVQVVSPFPAVPVPILSHDGPIGTLGNPDFLATLLGVGIFLGLERREKETLPNARAWANVGLAILAVGILATRNKGTILFVTAWALISYVPRFRTQILALGGVAVVAIALLSTSVRARAFLWLAGLKIFWDHALSGVGAGQVGNYYLDAVYKMFSSSPWLSGSFGDLTGNVMHTHNVVLQQACEFGIAGALLGLVFVRHVWRVAKNAPHLRSMGLLFLLYKMQFSVVLESPTGILLIIALLASCEREEPSDATAHSITGRIAPLLLSITILAVIAVHAASDHQLGRAHHALVTGNRDDAQGYFERAMAFYGENGEAYLGQAYSAFLVKDSARMDEYIRSGLAYKRDIDALKISAHLYYYSGLYSEAEPLYRFLLVCFPEHLTSMVRLAGISMAQGRGEEARILAAQTIALDPRRKNESDLLNKVQAKEILAQLGMEQGR